MSASEHVAVVVVSHSEPLASAAVGLAREMASADDVRIEVAAGTDDGGTGTDAARIMAALEDCAGHPGVLVLLDLGSAVLSAETALDMVDPDLAERVTLSAGPLVEGLVVAAVAAAGGATPADVAAQARDALRAKAAHLGPASSGAAEAQQRDEDQAGEEAAAAATASGEASGTFDVLAEHGLHARPAALLAGAVAELSAEVTLRNLTVPAGPEPADSMLHIALLNAQRGHTVEVRATGPGARDAVDHVLALAADRFGDEA